MTKPKNNIVWCPDAFRKKQLFQTEAKANAFIKWNGGDFKIHNAGVLRAYYCSACCGWHITSAKYKKKYEKNTQTLIEEYNKDIKNIESFNKKE